MTSKYTISKIHSKMTDFQCLRKRGTRRISAKNDDVNFSRILNFFNDQINLEEIKYEKNHPRDENKFSWINNFWWSSNRICPISKPVWIFPELKDRPVTNRTEKSKSQKGRTRSFYWSIFEKNRQAKNFDFLKTALTDKQTCFSQF